MLQLAPSQSVPLDYVGLHSQTASLHSHEDRLPLLYIGIHSGGKYFLVDSRTGASHTNLHIYNVLIDALLHISAASFHLEELLIQSRNHP